MNMGQFSIIVPVLGDHREFESTLASVLRYLPDRSEVLVPCAQDYSDPFGIGTEVSLLRLPDRDRDPLVHYWRAGLTATRFPLVAWFLPGIELHQGWERPVLAGFRDPGVAVVSPRLVAGDINTTANGTSGIRILKSLRSKVVRVRNGQSAAVDGPTAWAGIYRNEALSWIDVDNTGLSDSTLGLELALSLRTLGYRCQFQSDCVLGCTPSMMEDAPASSVDEQNLERIQNRFVQDQNSGPGARILRDLLTFRWSACLGKFAARRFAEADSQYRESLEKSCAARSRLEKAASLPLPSAVASSQTAARRAA